MTLAHASGHDQIMFEATIVQLLLWLPKPGRYFSDVDLLTESMMTRGNEISQCDPFDLRGAVASADLPTQLKLRFLIPFLTKEHSYEFELSHWEHLKNQISTDKIRAERMNTDCYYFSSIISKVIHNDPEVAIECLVELLLDDTYIDMNVTVGTAVSTLLFIHRHLGFGLLCELLAPFDEGNAVLLIKKIAKADAMETLAVCRRWTDGNDSILRKQAVQLAYLIAEDYDDNCQNAVFDILKSFIECEDPELCNLALQGIGKLRKYRHQVIRPLLERFISGEPTVEGYIVADWGKEYFNEVVDVVSNQIGTGKNPEHWCQAIFSLSRIPGKTEKERNRVIDLLILGERNGLLASSTFRIALEYSLMKVDSEQERNRMNDFARKVVMRTPNVRHNLFIFAANKYLITYKLPPI